MKISALSQEQWLKVAKALGYSFVSTFLGVIVASGGVQSTYEANIALALAALVSGINAVLYALSRLFVEE